MNTLAARVTTALSGGMPAMLRRSAERPPRSLRDTLHSKPTSFVRLHLLS